MNYIAGNLLVHLHPNNFVNANKSYGMKEVTIEIYEEKVFWLFVYINFEKN